MAWQDESRHCDFRWILKCPFYLPYLQELAESFPDASIIWIHRDPVDSIGSACSLYEALMSMTSDTWTIDRTALGRAVVEYSDIQLKKAEEFIAKQSSKLHLVHVRYSDIIKDPNKVLRRLSRKVTGKS